MIEMIGDDNEDVVRRRRDDACDGYAMKMRS